MNRLREVEDLTRELEQLFVLPVLFLDGLPLLVGDRLTLRVRPVLADHHEGRRKIASSETIIVSSPYGYFSTPKPIQQPNQAMWM